ncbi:MAG: site-specific integrase, partial [Actinomycetota bacterium]|nr:site-specific integrase [Actinomycetota bacterium]
MTTTEGNGRRFDWPRQDPETGLWWFKCPVGKDPETGRRRQTRRGGFATKKAAAAEMDAVRHSIRTNTYTPAKDQRVPLRDYLTEWLAGMRGQVRDSTWESYSRNLQTHVIPRLGAERLVDLTPTKLTALYAELQRDGRRDQKAGGLAPRTVSYIATILRSALADADELLPRGNPADKAKRPTADATRAPGIRAWTADELRRFLEYTEGDRYYPAWLTLALTGARRGELLGWRWRDLDLDRGRASIRQSVTAVRHDVRVGPTKTGRARVVDLDSETVAVLRAWRTRQREEMFMFGRHQDDDTLLFSWPEDGRSYHPDRFSREFKRKQQAYNLRHPDDPLPRLRLHDFRHTAA